MNNSQKVSNYWLIANQQTEIVPALWDKKGSLNLGQKSRSTFSWYKENNLPTLRPRCYWRLMGWNKQQPKTK